MKRATGVLTLLLAVPLILLGLGGCTEAEEAVLLEDPPVDSVTFWPPHLQYARQGDTLHLRIHGIKRQRICAEPLQLSWNFRHDSTGTEHYQFRSRFVIPAGASCKKDPEGLDTVFRVRFFTRVGNTLYLETPQGTITDSLRFIAGDAPDLVTVLTLRHGGGDSTTSGRLSYRDSTAAHPRRVVRVNDLATCEIVQAAVYERQADSTVVKVRLIKAAAQPAASFPPCAGPRTDSLEAVPNRHNYLP